MSQSDRRLVIDSTSSCERQLMPIVSESASDCRRYNTWIGDPARVLLFNAIYDQIVDHNLVDHTAQVGDYVHHGISQLQTKHPDLIQNLRGKGQGTFIAWDAPTAGARDNFIKRMRAHGVHMGGCGERAVRLRPMLCFQRKHADILLSTMEKVLGGGGSKL